jgi:universal stress protein A
MAPKKILFCTDFSKNSEPAGQMAVEMGKAFGAELLVLHVINPRLLKYPSLEDLPLGDVSLADIEKKANENLAAVAKTFSGDLGDVKTFCLSGAPADAIVGFAQEQCVDMIVMGTHGWTALSHMLVGSTAEHVARMAHRPVLTVWCCGPNECS